MHIQFFSRRVFLSFTRSSFALFAFSVGRSFHFAAWFAQDLGINHSTPRRLIDSSPSKLFRNFMIHFVTQIPSCSSNSNLRDLHFVQGIRLTSLVCWFVHNKLLTQTSTALILRPRMNFILSDYAHGQTRIFSYIKNPAQKLYCSIADIHCFNFSWSLVSKPYS
jgi:hypothetical protein